MAISYKLETFEGPLDLLLHLIEKNKVDIYDIPIVEITRQYLDYVRRMEREDLNLVSDFLVMAATLLDIKSQMLLPAEPEADGEEEDPRAELVARLLEYKRYKRMALRLQDMEEEADGALFKAPTVPETVAKYEPPVDLDGMLEGLSLAKLKRVFDSVMKRQRDKIDPIRSGFGTIRREPVSLKTRIREVLDYARAHRRFCFRQMLVRRGDRLEIVVTFLAVLELTRLGKTGLTQEATFGEMQIETLEREGEEEDPELEEIGEFEE